MRAENYVPESSGGRAMPVSPAPEVRFELAGALAAGGSATAYVRYWDGTAWVRGTRTITVYDSLGSFSGPAGKYGIARWWADSHRWEVHQLQC